MIVILIISVPDLISSPAFPTCGFKLIKHFALAFLVAAAARVVIFSIFTSMPYLRRHYLPTLPPKEWAFSLNACHLEGKDRRLRWKSATCRTSAVRSVIALAISAKTGRWTEIGADVDGSIGLGTLADRSTSRLTVAISIIPCSMVHFFYVWDSDLLSRAQKIFIHCCQFGCWHFQGLTGLSVLLVQSGCISVLMFSVSSSIHASTSPLSSSSESKKSSQFQI